jgi:hypothetical protein
LVWRAPPARDHDSGLPSPSLKMEWGTGRGKGWRGGVEGGWRLPWAGLMRPRRCIHVPQEHGQEWNAMAPSAARGQAPASSPHVHHEVQTLF